MHRRAGEACSHKVDPLNEAASAEFLQRRLLASQHISSMWGRAFLSLRRLLAASYFTIRWDHRHQSPRPGSRVYHIVLNTADK